MVTLRVNRPLVRKILILGAGFLAIWAILGFLFLPPILRGVLERKLSEALHRPATLRRLAFNPFTFEATLEGLDVKEKGGKGPFLSFERLAMNFEAMSLFRGGPVARSVRLAKPSITLIRNADGTYNVQDLLDEAAKPKPPAEKPLRFSFNNIQIENGSLDFDDRPESTRHQVRDIDIGIPFLSNIPSKVEITTQPVFHAKVNGAPFDLRGSTKPFSPTHETTVNLNLTDLDLPYYLAYVPKTMPSRITSGRLDTRLALTFSQPGGGSPRLVVTGTTAVRSLAATFSGRPVLKCESFDAALASFDVFARKARFSSVKVVAPEIWVRRDKEGRRPILEAFIAPAVRTEKKAPESLPAKRPEQPAPPLVVEVAQIGVERGTVHHEEMSDTAQPFHVDIHDLAVSVKDASTAPGKTASLEFSGKAETGETFQNTGTVTLDPLVLEGDFAAGSIPLKRYRPFYAERVLFEIEDGTLEVKTKYRFEGGEKGNTTLSGLSADLRTPRLVKRGERDPFFQAPSLKVGGTNVDLGKHDVTVGEISSAGGVLAVLRDKDGNPDLAKLVAPSPPSAAQAPREAPWRIALGRLALDGYTVKIDDRSIRVPARYRLTNTGLVLEKISTEKGSKGNLTFRFGVDGKGVAGVQGPVGFDPMFADLKTDVKAIPLVPIQGYIVQDFNVSLARGTVSAAGSLHFGQGADGKASFTYKGGALVSQFLVLDRATNLDLLKWESFSAEGMNAGFNPMFLEISRLSMSGIGADVSIEPDGTTSLQRVTGKAPAKEAPPGTETEGAADGSAAATAAGSSPPADSPAPPPAAPANASSNDKVPIRIDTLAVQGGRIGFADRSIQPNYVATLSGVAGTVKGLNSREGTVAQLDLRGSLANHSPLQISGSVNPLSASAFADVKASFHDIDLPPFTGYSGKYAGYGIARGVLSMDVAYKLDHRKLAAQNHFLVDQFDFGEKIESRTATKLPVRLAVSLLKDKDGLIDLDLPIEGSLDDPKFKIWGVLWKVVGNLVGKAVTAPFTLLGKLLGGKGEEFSSVEFADGHEAPDEAARKKLDALAHALTQRPALKLEAAGRTSGEADREGLKKLRLERKVKAQKLASMAKKDDAPASVDDVVVEEKEYETFLKKAYKKEDFKKPTNTLGFARDIPASEMEELMLANLTVTDDDLRQLALARANSVKDYLANSGKIDVSRIFVVDPGSKPPDPNARGRASRVDFTLR